VNIAPKRGAGSACTPMGSFVEKQFEGIDHYCSRDLVLLPAPSALSVNRIRTESTAIKGDGAEGAELRPAIKLTTIDGYPAHFGAVFPSVSVVQVGPIY
jgi:hypothetical protein